MKNYLLFILLAAFSILSFQACDDEEPTPQTGELNLKVNLTVGGTPLVLDQEYTDPLGKLIKFTRFKFYLSNLEVVDANGNAILVKDVELVDAEDEITQSISATLDPGSYDRIRLGIGLNETMNAEDPSAFPADHPMSSLTGMYWSWTSKYIFLMIDGNGDSTGTGNDYSAFVYHTGTDSLYREKELAGRNIEITAGSVTDHALNIDLLDIFYASSDTINFTDPNQTFTHTIGSFPLAERVTQNFLQAIQ